MPRTINSKCDSMVLEVDEFKDKLNGTKQQHTSESKDSLFEISLDSESEASSFERNARKRIKNSRMKCFKENCKSLSFYVILLVLISTAITIAFFDETERPEPDASDPTISPFPSSRED